MKRKRIRTLSHKTRKAVVSSDHTSSNNLHPAPKVYDMLVFSHLRWHFVYQRPQHLMERLSKHYRILFVEEPVPADNNTASGELIAINKNLDVLRTFGYGEEVMAKALKLYIANAKMPVGWFYSAAFVPFIQQFSFDKIVYDCMDELTLFKGANQELAAQEKYLLSEADVVFTGGKSLYEGKKGLHKNVRCFPSSVDRAHFSKALNGISIPSDMRLAHPVIGYYGVIDERIDLELIRNAAERMPNASFVMVGPLAKIHENDLPRLHNIHYTGMKPYNILPAYLKAFDIAMMPFALNDATRFISPTKTLEFMAAEKPIISTAVYDVVRDYSHCVNVISNAEEFCAAINSIMADLPKIKERIRRQYDDVLKATSWEQTAENMYSLIKSEK